MDAVDLSPLPAGTSAVDLVDVLSVPTVGAAVLSCLTSKSALRRTCSAICALVDHHVEALRILCREQDDVVVAGQLARKALKPKRVTIDGGRAGSSAVAALLATEQHQPMFQRVQQLTLRSSLPKDLPQDVFVSMPVLTHLETGPQLTGQDAQMLAAVRLGMLRSLNVCMDLCHACFLRGCTQLKELTLYTMTVKGVGAIAQLTGLTRLNLYSGSWTQRVMPAAEQSELGSALAALSGLQSLRISHAPPGPVTQALSQLTGLTELWLLEQHWVHNPSPLVLPSCVRLTLRDGISVEHLASIQAPNLGHLDVNLAVEPNDLGALERLCKGVLRACSSLPLDLGACSKEDTVALMSVLSQDRRPSAEALQPTGPDSIGIEESSSSNHAGRWSLKLDFTHCSRQCMELLPKGLGSLDLWDCALDPDSLDPLAQLASLRELRLYKCSGVTIASLERLFTTSVQGCLLAVTVDVDTDPLPEFAGQDLSPEACTQMHQLVVAQRGSRDKPGLEIR